VNYTYEINDSTNVIKIFENDMPCVTQPVSPTTGEPFTSKEEAQAWAEAHIAERQSWYEAPAQ